MLYEVITAAVRAATEDLVELILPAGVDGLDAGCRNADGSLNHRITSYNVCYTKLLREFGDLGLDLDADPARITSYNVCYTKLLRAEARRGR